MNFPLECGKIVACYLDKYREEEPLIGKILEDNDDMLTVNWMSGSYSDPWHPCKLRGELWTENIPKASVICEVKLTRGSRLVEPVKKRLKRAYGKM